MSHTIDGSRSPLFLRARLGLATIALLVGVLFATVSCVSDLSDINDPCALMTTESDGARDVAITSSCPKPPEAVFTTAPATAGTGSGDSVSGCADPKTCTERPGTVIEGTGARATQAYVKSGKNVFVSAFTTSSTGPGDSIGGCGDPRTCTDDPGSVTGQGP